MKEGGYDIYASPFVLDTQELNDMQAEVTRHEGQWPQDYSIVKQTKEMNYPDAMIVVETNRQIAGTQASL